MSKWRVWVAAVLVTAFSVTALSVVPAEPAFAAARPAPVRGMWVWQQAPVAEVVAWAVAHDVRDVFVSFPTDTTDLSWYRSLKVRADAAHLTLAALGGDAGWALDPSAASRWVAAVRRANLFAGLHVDVEPYVLPAWSTGRTALAQGYLRLLDLLRATGMPVEVDVPFWYSTVVLPGGGNLADAVLARVSRVTVMSYRSTVPSLMDVARDMLTRARPGTSVRLAVETQQLADCPYCTFYGTRESALTSALGDIDRQAAGYATYAGIAVHQYQAWRALSA